VSIFPRELKKKLLSKKFKRIFKYKYKLRCGFDINGRSIFITAKQTVEGKRSIPIDFNPVNKIKDTETNTK